MPVMVRLDHIVGAGLVRSQIAATKATGIDANDVATVQNVPGGLGRVAQENAFAAEMRGRQRPCQVIPINGRVILFVHRQPRIVSRVNKDRVGRLMVGHQILKKGEMMRRDSGKTSPIAAHRGDTAIVQPDGVIESAENDSEQHDFMVAAQRHDLAFFLKRDQLIHDITTVGTTIDVVSQKNQLVFASRINGLNQRAQRLGATVNVAYHKTSHRFPIDLRLHRPPKRPVSTESNDSLLPHAAIEIMGTALQMSKAAQFIFGSPNLTPGAISVRIS